MSSFKINSIQTEFPFLSKESENKVIYFDSAATTHKPNLVLNSIHNFYKNTNSNIHRSTHTLGSKATEEYELARKVVAQFIGAKTEKEIVFTSGATESINLVANCFVKQLLQKNDVILISEVEHHSNLIPWQVLCKQIGCQLKTIPFNQNFQLDFEAPGLLDSRVRFIAIHHVSNVTGCVQKLKGFIEKAHKLNIPVLIDGAQAISHLEVNVNDLDCDFYCFSGHKMFAPTGTGVLYGKGALLEKFSPYRYGGGMVPRVSIQKSEWEEGPVRLEAGTPNVCGAIALSKAISFIEKLGIESIVKHEKTLVKETLSVLEKIPNIILYRSSESSLPIFSFNIKNTHPYDIASLLAENRVFVRSGHLCCQPLMNRLKIDGCVRVSMTFYNTVAEIKQFGQILEKIIKFLK